MQTILRGSANTERFILGKNGVAYGSNDPGNDQYWNGDGEQDDDNLIIGLDPRKDTIFLAGTKEDYLIRPTSLPFSVEGLPAGTGFVAIILTDRNNRILSSDNELTTIAWIAIPRSDTRSLSYEEIGLMRDPADRDGRGYYTANSSGIFVFEGGGVPLRSSQGGFIEENTSGSNSGSQINIQSSGTQISEGDSLLTTIETSYSSNTPLYFKIVGNGVNNKDFSSGGVKGKVFTGGDGSASISHVLRNDRATEGSESFKIQFFSDKKMSSLVGESGTTTVLDTSVKSVKAKPTKNPKGTAKDSVTGLTWDFGIGTVVNDKYYDTQSDIIQKLRSQGSDMTGIEFEMSQDLIIINRIYANANGSLDFHRGAYSGKFEYSNGSLSKLTVNSFGLYKAEEVAGGIPKYESVEVTNFPAPQVYQAPSNSNIENGGLPRAVDASKFNGAVTGNFNDIYSFAGGKVFTESWWLNPIDSNLLA